MMKDVLLIRKELDSMVDSIKKMLTFQQDELTIKSEVESNSELKRSTLRLLVSLAPLSNECLSS